MEQSLKKWALCKEAITNIGAGIVIRVILLHIQRERIKAASVDVNQLVDLPVNSRCDRIWWSTLILCHFLSKGTIYVNPYLYSPLLGDHMMEECLTTGDIQLYIHLY